MPAQEFPVRGHHAAEVLRQLPSIDHAFNPFVSSPGHPAA
jgi:hypothetical protein